MKQEKNYPKHLLDYLAQEADLIYLSDLHEPQGELLTKLVEAVDAYEVDAASLQEWNATLRYIAGAPLEMTAERAKASLLVYLTANK